MMVFLIVSGMINVLAVVLLLRYLVARRHAQRYVDRARELHHQADFVRDMYMRAETAHVEARVLVDHLVRTEGESPAARAALLAANEHLERCVSVRAELERIETSILSHDRPDSWDTVVGSMLSGPWEVSRRIVALVSARRSVRVHRPPAMRLTGVARWIFSAKTYARVIEPAHADVMHAWQEAEAGKNFRAAWWIKWVRGPASILVHVASQIPYSALKWIVHLIKLA